MADLGYWSTLPPPGMVELVPLRLDVLGLGPAIVAVPWIVDDWRTDELGDCLSPFLWWTESMFQWILRGDRSPRGGRLLLVGGRTTSPSSPLVFDPQVDALVSIVPDSPWIMVMRLYLKKDKN